MSIKSDIKRIFQTNDVRQYDSKQLFLVDGNKLVSYKTIIGRFVGGTWYITNKRYSVTTSRHKSFFAKQTSFPVVYVDVLPSDDHG